MSLKKIKFYLITVLLTVVSVYTFEAQNTDIEITFKRNEDKSIDFSYTKQIYGSYYLKLEFDNLENCHSSGFKGVIKNQQGSLIKLEPTNNQQHINFSYTYSYIRGVVNPKVDTLFNYILPFKKGKKLKVIENSTLGEKYFGNKTSSNWKSYLVYTNTPDTIHSMRKGIVVEIVNKYKADTLTEKIYTSKRNRIVIEHADGTYASYTGIKKNSIFVKLGQIVYPQTKLGIIDVFNKGQYRLNFSIHYLINSDLEVQKNRTLKNAKNNHESLIPYFNTELGVSKLDPNTEYIVNFNESILFEELTRREKKKYKKNLNVFN